ncbi:stage II sporulation protein AA (anti-sigma F factor antagonist) [Paenibacillus phyllosphaerae]|uniref:Stage II sporulation protein AA (Anti-sigma F factor antagonist) n=1 Tax=Paenibacillus phyllosphaerae TaxID=274593 RepID=A0A7W5B5B4_9BACL|nr:stage II sporulation protein AA (anti-sigma F factor antagonist) [Paenibacillus phyllosphaerae]
MEQPLVIDKREFPGGYVVQLKGELTRASEQDLLGRFTVENEQIRFLALDLTEVAYINSGGMAVLIRLARTAKKSGTHTFVWGITAHYEKLFRMVGLTEWVMLYPNEFAVMQRIEALGQQ